MVISFIEKILSLIFQNSVENFFKRRPDDLRTTPDVVRTSSGRLQGKKYFYTVLFQNNRSTLILNIKRANLHNVTIFDLQVRKPYKIAFHMLKSHLEVINTIFCSKCTFCLHRK